MSKAYKPRTWYTSCQMGTMTQGICKLKNNEKKNKKIQHERMRQGNARIIVIHPFVFGLSIFLSLIVKVMDGLYNIVNDPEIFILETA